MEKPEGIVLLGCVCCLLVIVLATVESGRVSGADYKTGLPIPGLNFSWSRFGNPVNGTQNTEQSSQSVGTVQTAELPRPNPFPSLVLFAFLPTAPFWFLAALAAVCFIGACFFALRLKTTTRVVDLEETLKEMEVQQRRLAEAWSHELRNMALLRYYLLMKRACSKVGLQETMTETPKEYIQRASSYLMVDGSDAAKFANTVNQCRYGEELSNEDAREASRFMGIFTDVVRSKANET